MFKTGLKTMPFSNYNNQPVLILQGSSLPVFTKFDNPASVAAPVSRTLSYLVLPAYNIGLLLCPANLCCDWTMGSISLITSISGI